MMGDRIRGLRVEGWDHSDSWEYYYVRDLYHRLHLLRFHLHWCFLLHLAVSLGMGSAMNTDNLYVGESTLLSNSLLFLVWR